MLRNFTKSWDSKQEKRSPGSQKKFMTRHYKQPTRVLQPPLQMGLLVSEHTSVSTDKKVPNSGRRKEDEERPEKARSEVRQLNCKFSINHRYSFLQNNDIHSAINMNQKRTSRPNLNIIQQGAKVQCPQ